MEKSIKITVYVVKPRVTNQEHISGHRRRHLLNPGGAAYDRKAQLLLYSRQLRSTACRDQMKASGQKARARKKVKEGIQIVSSCRKQERVKEDLKIRSNNQNSHQKIITSAKKVVPVELHDPVHAKLPETAPSSFRDWRKILLPSIFGRIFGSRNRKNENNYNMNMKKKKKKLSVSLSEKMSEILMSSKIEKERIGIKAKFFSLTGKRR